MIALLPALFLLIVVIIAIAYIVPKIGSKITRITWKGSLRLSGLYLGILILVIPIYYFLPKEGTNNVENRNNAVAISQKTMNNLLNQHLSPEDNLDDLPGLFKNSSYTFQVDTKKLSFNLPSNAGIYPILIVPKKVDDGIIEVRTYITTQFVGEIDYTKFVSPPVITLQNGTMSFEITHQSLHFIQCTADFTVNQFKNQNIGNENGLSTTFGDKVVYIRVPKSLEVDTKENPVIMISD